MGLGDRLTLGSYHNYLVANKEEEMIVTREMEDARARLEAYADKIHPYPCYPEETLADTERIERLEKKLSEPISNQQLYKSFDQLKAEFIFIRNKFNKLYDKKEPNDIHIVVK